MSNLGLCLFSASKKKKKIDSCSDAHLSGMEWKTSIVLVEDELDLKIKCH
jgi:hypothetical protein